MDCQGVVKDGWSDASQVDGFKLGKMVWTILRIFNCKFCDFAMQKVLKGISCLYWKSVLKPRTCSNGSISSLRFHGFLVGVAPKCHSFGFMECLLDFLESHGLHVFRWLIFIGLTVGVFFFLTVEHSAIGRCSIVPIVQNLWQWSRWAYWKTGLFSRKQQRYGPTFHGWLKLGLSRHILAFLARKHHDSGKAQSKKPWWFYFKGLRHQ